MPESSPIWLWDYLPEQRLPGQQSSSLSVVQVGCQPHNESFPEDACWSPVGVHRTNVIEGEWDVYYGGAGAAEEVTVCLQLFHFHIALDPSQFHLLGMLFWFRSFRDAPKGDSRLT